MVGQIINKELRAIEIDRKEADGPGYFVLALLQNRLSDGSGEFATWFLGPDGSLSSGHYFVTLVDAWDDFKERY